MQLQKTGARIGRRTTVCEVCLHGPFWPGRWAIKILDSDTWLMGHWTEPASLLPFSFFSSFALQHVGPRSEMAGDEKKM